MEIVLDQNTQNQIIVTCDGKPSHTFALLPQEDSVLTNPVEIGKGLFAALFAVGSSARAAWDAHPKERILLVAQDTALDAIPWEYLYGPNGFIVLDCAFVRGLPAPRRQPALNLTEIPLHIVAIPSNPIDHDISRLDIAGEWTRLKDSIRGLETAIRLERVRPSTLEQTRRLVANQRQRVIHFMGHGGHNGSDSFLFFENEYGGPKPVTAQDFIRRMEDSAFLVTLNACVSATPGKTEFSNLARALTERGVPYALGMRFTIPDSDAKAFSETFYSELARGSSVENALRQARNSLADGKNPWVVGTPVLYTSLNEDAKGFETASGAPRIDEHQPPLEVSALPRAEGAFQGRVDELLTLGKYLTRDVKKLITIHGPGGQGKTALAREAVERFAHAWPGGVWAISLENNTTLNRFTLELARLLKIDLDSIYKQIASAHPNQETDVFQGYVQQELERRILATLNNQCSLLVLDNAETFIEAVEAKDKAAFDLAAFLREKVLSTQASLLLTSRNHLGWSGEEALELLGLSDEEGAKLFTQCAQIRGKDAIGPEREEISRKVGGHPLSLRLLGSAFNSSAVLLDSFIREVETTLLEANDKYKYEDHRHSTLYASIETSTRHLSETERALLSGLWIFQTSFMSETAAEIFTPSDLPEAERKTLQEQINGRLHTLYRRGLLLREQETLASDNIVLYRTLPIVRLFVKEYLEQSLPMETLRAKMGSAYSALLQNINRQIDRSSWASYLARRFREDMEACTSWVKSSEQGWYLNRLGWILQRIGDRWAGMHYLEHALEITQGIDQNLQLHIFNNMGFVYRAMGQPMQALALYQRAQSIAREVGDRAGEAASLGNMGLVYIAIGQPVQALALYEQALSTTREVGNRAGEAATLDNIAGVYRDIGQMGQALTFYEQALPIRREVGDRAGEAITLSNIGGVYQAIGQPKEALALFEQVLPMLREVGDRAEEAATLNNMGLVSRNTGQLVQALTLYQQALTLMREVSSQAGEAATLSNIAQLYSDMRQPVQALGLFEQVLPMLREVGDRAGEATTLNNMATLYGNMGQSMQALTIFEQILYIAREVGDRAGEAVILNNMATVYRNTEQPMQALALYEQALTLMREAGNQAGEVTTLASTAVLLYSHLSRLADAIALLEQAIAILQKLGLSQDTSGTTISQMQMVLQQMKVGQPLSGTARSTSGFSSKNIETLANNTVTVLTEMPEKLNEWHQTVSRIMQKIQGNKQQPEIEFLASILALLDGKTPEISVENPYAWAVQAILQTLTDGNTPINEPFPGDSHDQA